MTRRASFDGAQQEQALRSLLAWSREERGLRSRSGKGLLHLAQELGMGKKQLERYINGEQPLRSDQFGPFAAAFGTTEAELIASCFPSVRTIGPTEPYSPRAEMEASGVVPPRRVDQVEADVAGRPESAQRARVTGEIALQHERRPEAPSAPAPSKTRRRRTG